MLTHLGSSMSFGIVSSTATTKSKLLLKDKHDDWTSRRAIQAIKVWALQRPVLSLRLRSLYDLIKVWCFTQNMYRYNIHLVNI